MKKLEVIIPTEKNIENYDVILYDGSNNAVDHRIYKNNGPSIRITTSNMNAIYFRVNGGKVHYLYFDMISDSPNILNIPFMQPYGISGKTPMYKIDYDNAIARYIDMKGQIWYEKIDKIFSPNQNFISFDIAYTNGYGVSIFSGQESTIPGLGFLIKLFLFLLNYLGYEYVILIVIIIVVVMVGIFLKRCK